jgi:aspartyl protease family protein
MRVLVIILIGVSVLALAVGFGAGNLLGLDSDRVVSALPLIVLLAVLAGGLLARRSRPTQLVTNIALWVGIFAVLLVGYSYRDDLSRIGARVFGELLPGQAIVDTERGSVTFRRGRDGHFQVNAAINGTDIPLIFDTGASAVVLTSADARRAGIDTSTLRYNVPVSTANGTGRAASVRLDRIEIGGIVRENIRAFIAEDGALETSLLGMTFLETLESYSVSQNSLELIG